MRGRSRGWLALGVGLGFAGAAAACSVGVDPAAKIEVVSGGVMVQDPICDADPPSVAKIIMNEGETLVLQAVPVDGDCNKLTGWDKLIKASGTLKASEMFGSDPMGLVSFVASGEPAPGHPFSWSITGAPSGAGLPTGGTTPESLENALIDIGSNAFDPSDPSPPPAADGNYKITAPTSGSPQGRLVVALSMGVPVRTIYHINKLAGGFGPDLAGYDDIAPSGTHIGYNPSNNTEILSEAGTMEHGGQISVNFSTPTFREGVPNWSDIHYSVVGEVSIPWGFEGVSIPIGICLYATPPATDTNGDGVIDSNDTPPSTACEPQPDATLTINGVIYHKGSITGGGEGHPGAAVIAVQDTSEPIAGDAGTVTGQAFAGRNVTIDPIEIRAWDNNPRALPEDFELQAWYLVERSVWGRDGTAGSEGQLGIAGDPGTYHAAFADDTFAASPGHAFRWVKVNSVSANGVNPVPGPDGSPVGVEVTFDPIIPDEPTGVHFVDSVSGGGNYANYAEDGLKLVYRVVDFNSGKGHPATDPGLDATNPDLTVAESWGGEIPEGYVTGGGAQTEAFNDGIGDPTLLNACSACGGRAILAGLPTWSVDDDLPPALVLIAHDKKYDKVYYFGHTLLGDANCGGGPDCSDGLNQRYMTARQEGTISSPDSENMTIQPWSPSNTVFNDESAFDYASQRGEYLASFFPAALNYYGETYPGLWIDEDTRVEFFVTAWDNAEGWKLNGPSGGKLGGGVDLGQIHFELFDGPTEGASAVMSEPGTYLFRNPNRPDDLGRAYAKVSATDINGNTTEFEVDIFIADNSLKIYSLEESRNRLSND